MTIVTSIQILEKLFVEFNNHFFNGELETPLIHYYPDEKCKTYGHMTRQRIWTTIDKSQLAYELNICCNTVRGEQCYATLLHEMVHLYANMHEISDCSNSGHYHNKKFKKNAEEHGLVCTKFPGSTNYGFAHTKLTVESKAWINQLEKELPDIFRMEDSDFEPIESDTGTETDETEEKPIRKPRVQRTFKYICPGCKTLIKSREDSLEIHCNSCNMDFQKVLPRTAQHNYHLGENQ